MTVLDSLYQVRIYASTKAAIEAITGLAEGTIAYATDTDQFGSYNGSAWTWGQGAGSVIESALSFTDITTADASTTKHGLAPKATAPGAGLINFLGIANGETVYTNKALLNNNDPANVAAVAAAGTGNAASRSDHVHKATAALTGSIPIDGWISISATWTRTGNHTFTVSGDVTATYRKGAKVRYKDGGSYEYGVIGSSTYSSPNTTVNLIPNTDYAMAAVALTDTYLSYVESPEGFPAYFNYTATVTPNAGSITSYIVNQAIWTTWGSKIKIDVQYSLTNIGTGTGSTNFSTPIASTVTCFGCGRELTVNGKMLEALWNGATSTINVLYYDNTGVIANGLTPQLTIIGQF